MKFSNSELKLYAILFFIFLFINLVISKNFFITSILRSIISIAVIMILNTTIKAVINK
ncbi:hypothetical protein X275_06085 [Marinitoga sp. 1197]|nr:hypothetical protein X275_06085 [Marinitoga sp. 1197]